jgi:hypothetical protein
MSGHGHGHGHGHVYGHDLVRLSRDYGHTLTMETCAVG